MKRGLFMRSILLNPDNSTDLSTFYKAAIKNSTELLIATAFLTEWPITEKLNTNCNNILILVGTDFGLTRKKALTHLLNWSPSDKKSNLLAVPSFSGGSFHPKIIAWKESDGNHYVLLGSSNLTSAAFTNNYEANIVQKISSKEFNKIKRWLRSIAENSQVITNDWIEKYKETKRAATNRKANQNEKKKVIDLRIKIQKKHIKAILDRRNRQKTFKEIKPILLDILKLCADGNIENDEFWERFWDIWANHTSRFQGSGIQFSGKYANWEQACKSFLKIINGPNETFDMDLNVQSEIDFLASKKNPVRGAWLTEMLCHFYPTKYPLINKPVKSWLKIKKYKAQRGATEGSKYIELSRKMRDTMRQNPEIKTLAELDIVIWRIMDDLRKKEA